MEVTFTKLPGRRYRVSVVREAGLPLAPAQGPGYDEYLPHDLVHFVIEAEAGLHGGVFGRVAAGELSSFWPADPAEIRRARRRKSPPTPEQHADMARSELLTSVSKPLSDYRSGRRDELPVWFSGRSPDAPDIALLDRICERLGTLAERWHALPEGGSLTLAWPYPEGRRRTAGATRHRAAVRRRKHRFTSK